MDILKFAYMEKKMVKLSFELTLYQEGLFCSTNISLKQEALHLLQNPIRILIFWEESYEVHFPLSWHIQNISGKYHAKTELSTPLLLWCILLLQQSLLQPDFVGKWVNNMQYCILKPSDPWKFSNHVMWSILFAWGARGKKCIN